jgi:hypothetical protein
VEDCHFFEEEASTFSSSIQLAYATKMLLRHCAEINCALDWKVCCPGVSTELFTIIIEGLIDEIDSDFTHKENQEM